MSHIDATEVIIGKVLVSFDGVALGLTTEDGVSINPEVEITKLRAAQSVGVIDAHRPAVDLVVSATFYQLSLEKWALIDNLSTAPSNGTLQGRYRSNLRKGTLVLTLPGPNGSTRTMTATAAIITPGERIFNNREYTGSEVEFQLFINPETEEYWQIVETPGSSAAPAVVDVLSGTSGAGSTMADGATSIAVESFFILDFNVAIRPDQLTSEHFILKESTGNTEVECTYTYDNSGGSTDYTKVKVTPVEALTALTDYDLIVPKGVLSNDGVRSTAMFARQFMTA